MNKLKKKKWIPVIILVILAMAGIFFASKGGLMSENPFGENVYVFSPKDDPLVVKKIIDDTWASQETNQFGDKRVTFFFMPGVYDKSIEMKVGFYTQAAGLGLLPTDTRIESLKCDARWLSDDSNHNATCNFWRGVENITMNSDTLWAVSQATSMRRVQVNGSLYLHDDYGWASGGFLADSKIENLTDSGSQQQWLSRNCDWDYWLGENWNMVFVGMKEGKAPVGTWPGTKYTTVEDTPVIQEKPFVIYDKKDGYGVFVPEKSENSKGVSWENGGKGTVIDLDEFYIAGPKTDTADSMNKALKEGKHLILTPGIYNLDKAIEVNRENTIVLGLGLATLIPTQGNLCMKIGDADGIKVSGILYDAGETSSKTLLEVGEEKIHVSHQENPILLSDVYFRVGGAASYAAKADSCVVIHSDDVIGDNLWVWRADHGSNVAWDENYGRNGIIINGDNVTMYALLVEHFQEYQTIWNGNGGRTYFYQSEIPYDVPDQESWMSHNGKINGYASYKVGDKVTSHEAWGLGIYSYHRDAKVDLNSAMEVPDRDNVKIHNVCAIMITGNPGISHVINNSGDPAVIPGDRKVIIEYENGIK